MWNRVLLKQRAKAAFKANYWKCVLVALVLSLIVGGGTGGTGVNVGRQFGSNDVFDDYPSSYDTYDEFDDIGDIDNIGNIDEFDDIAEMPGIQNPGGGSNALFGSGILAILFVIILVAVILGLVLGIFVFNPLEVGCRKFFLDNSEGRGDDIGTMAFGFKNNYGNVVKVQFFRNLYVFLWSLLFIIPGIIKSYEYYMVPYLLSENPNMDSKEALETSKQMMQGNKMDTFVLEFSFIGWMILSGLTLGLLGLFYVNPYVYATTAELYRVLSGKISGTDDEQEEKPDLAKLYGGVREDDVYVTFETPNDNSTHD